MEIAINGYVNGELRTNAWGPWVFMIELLEGGQETHQIGLWHDGSVLVDALDQDEFSYDSAHYYPSLEDWKLLEQVVKKIIADKEEQ